MAQADQTITGTVPASGTLRLTLPTGGRRRDWQIQQISIDAPNVGSAAEAAFYRNGVLLVDMVATKDTADGQPYITARTGDRIYVEWTGATAGATAKATFIYDDGI